MILKGMKCDAKMMGGEQYLGEWWVGWGRDRGA